MGWFLVFLVWWCGASAIPSPGSNKAEEWKCPTISEATKVECSCDMPHTLRCTGDKTAMQIIGKALRSMKSASVSLLDCSIRDLAILSGPLLEDVSLHGLVISSGAIREVSQAAFRGLKSPLQALGLPNNQLATVPIVALRFLPELDRLDLSGNKLTSLDINSFKGLKNLSFIDVSNNAISKIAPYTFSKSYHLKTLRVRGNQIKMPTVTKLTPIPNLEELDLSENHLIGPLGPRTIQKMPSLTHLHLGYNFISSIKQGALQSLTALRSLSVQNNQIDVIEDHAFSQLPSLLSLDLSHNRIIAVSESSLAHLTNLREIDLSSNHLRALTSDLISSLKKLDTLKLEENDISIISEDAIQNKTNLKRFNLAGNPLNCDCTLKSFGTWLNDSSLPKVDKESAVCATPPTLENGLLIEISEDNLVCGADSHDNKVPTMATALKNRITLLKYDYDGEKVRLVWNIDEEGIPYTCDTIYVYEEEELSEVLVESTPVDCDSVDEDDDPSVLEIAVPITVDLRRRHRYRYCLVLLKNNDSDQVSLILGCSDVIPLISKKKIPEIVSVQGNFSDDGSLSLKAEVTPVANCNVNLVILDRDIVVMQRTVSCDTPNHSFTGLNSGSYKACASLISAMESPKGTCVDVVRNAQATSMSVDVILVTIFVIFCLLFTFTSGVKRLLLKLHPAGHHRQCFVPPDSEPEQISGYVKLHATTKV